MKTPTHKTYKIICTALLLGAFLFIFEQQHVRPGNEIAVIALRLMFLLSSMAMVALLIARKPFLAYIAMGIGFLMGFTRTEALTTHLLLLFLAAIILHRLALFTVERAEARQ